MAGLSLRFKAGALIVALAAFPASSPALAQGKEQSAQLELAKQAEKLKPGEWVLKPEIALDGPVLVYIDLSRQLAQRERRARGLTKRRCPTAPSKT